MMTKPVPSRKFEHYLELLGVQSGMVEPVGAKEDSEDPKNA